MRDIRNPAIAERAQDSRGEGARAAPEISKDQLNASESEDQRRLLVVSHPAVVSVNQEVYRELARRGWELTIVVPDRWRHPYSDSDVIPRALPGLEQALRPTRVIFPGRAQRHLYVCNPRSLCARVRPSVALIEAEPYSLAATQWGLAFTSLGVPFGVQCYENIDRPLPRPVVWLRSRVLRRAAFVAARSQTAATLARSWGARGEIGLAPPAVPGWPDVPATPARAFTVGYAGRLIESKGLLDLLAAARALGDPVELVFIGDGELKSELAGQQVAGSRARVRTGVSHDAMPAAYGELDVLVLPSHTTATWKEQFGRVIVEALWCGVPVVGSDSGEIPWLIGLTGGGLVFPEGDRDALADRLGRLREQPELRAELAARGRDAVERMFSVPAATDSLEHLLLGAAAQPRG
jgi:glycosyltransferase involved in cell wall biosynthesis